MTWRFFLSKNVPKRNGNRAATYPLMYGEAICDADSISTPWATLLEWSGVARHPVNHPETLTEQLSLEYVKGWERTLQRRLTWMPWV